VPFYVGAEQMGLAARDFVTHLKPFDSIFRLDNDRLQLNPDLITPEQRSQAIAPMLQQLHQKGVIDTVAKGIYMGGEESRVMQTGNLSRALKWMVTGIVILLILVVIGTMK
jgi:EAL domain-containing protein (putative c-di-GMP-specific phosphodiesterase class I)